MKYFDASQRPEKKRWSKWPWVPDGEEDLGPLVNEPPGVMLPTEFVRRTQTAIEVEWKAYEVRPDVLGDAIDGYHLDTAHLCPIAGNLGWARAYKGRNLRYMIRGLNIKNDLLVRVRGYNRKGGGEWSEVRRYRVEPPPPPKYVEHKDIPPLWRTMDIEDVIKDEKVEDPSPYLTSLIEKLYKCLHKNRTIIKICFRYYALVGASSSKDDDADTMSMSQFVNVANVLGLLEKGGLITSDIDRIFLRSVREGKSRLETVGAPAAAPAAEGSAPAGALLRRSGRKRAVPFRRVRPSRRMQRATICLSIILWAGLSGWRMRGLAILRTLAVSSPTRTLSGVWSILSRMSSRRMSTRSSICCMTPSLG